MTICLGQGLYFKRIIFAEKVQKKRWAVGCRKGADILQMEFWTAEKVQIAVVGPGRGGPEAKSALFLQKHSVKCRNSAEEVQIFCRFPCTRGDLSCKNLHFFCKYSAIFLQSKIPSALFLHFFCKNNYLVGHICCPRSRLS